MMVIKVVGTREYVVVKGTQRGIPHNRNLPTMANLYPQPVNQSFRFAVFVHVMHVFSVASRATPNLKSIVM